MNEWIFRLIQEDRRHLVADFLTLTYNTDHVPITKNNFMTLLPRHFTLFMKKLRKNTGQKRIKYFMCGEYGTKKGRPHYHAIIWSNYFGEESYRNAWTTDRRTGQAKVSLGDIHVGSVTPGSIAYTAKYMDKPKTVGVHKRDDRHPEFRRMSQKLGQNYLTESVIRYHKANLDKLYVVNEGYKIPLPRYYLDQLFTDEDKSKMIRYIVQAAFEKQEEDYQEAIKQGIPYTKFKQDRIDHIKATYYKNKLPRDLT